jgi:O-antigen biosynthesis protein WbqP
MLKRTFDLVMALFLCVLALVPFILSALAVAITSRGPVIFWSLRVGEDGKLFEMPKLRTMHVGAPLLATDRFADPKLYMTSVGSFLRRASLDEIPQLWCILRGQMSLVGPRPALFNQTELIGRRHELGISRMKPGLTGWAQVNGRDSISLDQKLALDLEYMQKQSVSFDVRIIMLTCFKVWHRAGVSH